jgi:hypothetical protein
VTAGRLELHQLVDNLDEKDVRAVLELVKSHTSSRKLPPRSAGNARDWLDRAMDPARPKRKLADQLAGVEPLASVSDLHQSKTPLTPEESAVLTEFLNS